MKHVIYISGSITDNTTGLPREGWQQQFMEAEQRLKDMGFEVINPVELASRADGEWATYSAMVRAIVSADDWPMFPAKPPRWYYLAECIKTLSSECMTLHVDISTTPNHARLAGLYVIGNPDDIRCSYGTMAEINFALSAGLPVFSQYYQGHRMNNMLQLVEGPTLADAAKQNKE